MLLIWLTIDKLTIYGQNDDICMVTCNIDPFLSMPQNIFSIYFIVVIGRTFSLWLTVVNRWLTVTYSNLLCLQTFKNVIVMYCIQMYLSEEDRLTCRV